MNFSPYVLFRRGSHGPADLAGVVPERTWSLLAESDPAQDSGLGQRLTDALHALIPVLPAENRRAWLKVKRDVHNGRVPRLPDGTPPAEVAELLAAWTAQREQGLRRNQEIAEVYGDDLDSARKALADIASAESFQRGVQLSGEDVHREVSAYAANPFDTSRKPSKRRRAESTITSFAYRVAFKPSPFGAFTELGAHPFEPEHPGNADGTVVMARLSVGLLAWMGHQLRRLDCADDVLRVRINNSLTVDGDTAVFARRPLEGDEDGFTPDRVITARNTGLITLLRSLLGEGERTVGDLREKLVAAGLDREAARNTLDKLISLGLCHLGLGFPDQLTTQAVATAARLRAAGSAQAVRCAEIYEGLHAIEAAFGRADAERRTALLAELRALVAEFVAVLDCPPPAREAMRAAVYEDVGTHSAAATWRPELLAANREHLGLFQRIVPVLDDATIEKLGLYAFATARHGQRDVPLLELYREFSALGPREASAVMCGIGDAESTRMRSLRTEFFGFLHEDEPEELRLDPDALARFADTLPATAVPWRSAAYRVQLGASAEQGDRIVVNGVTTGHGVFFSRYCDLLENEDGWNLRTALREHIGATAARQTDITAALGLNFNLHPRLSPLELVYPGSVSDGGDPLTLADLSVRPDPATRRLTLVSARDGLPIDLVPLNFLYPAAAPMLYRFLCAFAPTRTYRGGLWDQVGPAAGPRPRVVLGDLVLDRRSWRFPAADLPDRDGMEKQDLSALVGFDRWRVERGLPRHTFFRVRQPRPVSTERDVIAETRQWALEARSARLHKPHYLDSRNPFLLHVLAKQAGTGEVVFHECLPKPDAHAAEEFFVEHNLTEQDRKGAGHDR